MRKTHRINDGLKGETLLYLTIVFPCPEIQPQFPGRDNIFTSNTIESFGIRKFKKIIFNNHLVRVYQIS